VAFEYFFHIILATSKVVKIAVILSVIESYETCEF